MKIFSNLIALSLGIALSSCGGTYVGTINYKEQAASTKDSSRCKQIVRVEPFMDARSYYKESPKKIGELKGGFGEVYKSIYLEKAVSEETSEVLTSFLKSRGCSPEKGSPDSSGITITGRVNDFYTQVLWAGQIGINIFLQVNDSSTGETIWSGTIKKDYGGYPVDSFPGIKEKYGIDCSVGWDCNARLMTAGLDLLYNQGIADIWENGLKGAVADR